MIVQLLEPDLVFRRGRGYYPIYIKQYEPFLPPPLNIVSLYPIVLKSCPIEFHKCKDISKKLELILRNDYKLKVLRKNIQIINDDDTDEVVEKISKIKENGLREEKQWGRLPLLLVFGKKTPRWYKPSPYYIIKAICEDQVVSQYITEGILSNYGMSLENIALAIFTKLGGTPWIPSTQPKSDIIVGIATTMVRIYCNGLPTDTRYIGALSIYRYTTYPVFKDFTSMVFRDKEEFREKFSEILHESLSSLIQEALREGLSKINISIHYSGKRPNKSEIEMIKEVLDTFQIQVDYVIATVRDDTIYRVFSPEYDYYPPKSFLIQLSDTEGLVTTGGAIMINNRKYYHPVGMPRCLKIEIIDTNKSRALFETAEDILVLTKLHWHTMSTRIREPISTRYTRRLAYLMASLQYLSAILHSRDIKFRVHRQIKSSRLWFL